MSILDYFDNLKKEKARQKRKDTARKLAAGAGIGVALGALAGLLFAPKSGKETRKDITDKTKMVAGEIGKKMGEAKTGISEKASRITKDFGSAVKSIRKTVEKLSGRKSEETAEACGAEEEQQPEGNETTGQEEESKSE